jgi:hypothetical protein
LVEKEEVEVEVEVEVEEEEEDQHKFLQNCTVFIDCFLLENPDP